MAVVSRRDYDDSWRRRPVGPSSSPPTIPLAAIEEALGEPEHVAYAMIVRLAREAREAHERGDR
jgi:hypothetical protein